VGLGGNKGRNKAPRDRDRNKAPKDVQVARLQRAALKRVQRKYRNLVLEKRTAVGIERKRRWWQFIVAAPGYGQVGLTHTEGIYRRAFRPRVLARRMASAAAAQTPNAEVAA
jgi:ribosomal protein L15E